jgi:hypothetical protein
MEMNDVEFAGLLDHVIDQDEFPATGSLHRSFLRSERRIGAMSRAPVTESPLPNRVTS